MLYFLLTTLLSGLITPLIIWLYKKNDWIEDPKNQSHVKVTHEKPVPRGGGIVIFLSVLLMSLFFLHVDSYLIAILIAGLLLAVVGWLDDVFDINPKIRLITGLVAALTVVGSGVGIAYITNPFGAGVINLDTWIVSFEFLGQMRNIWVLADIFAVLFILWNMNIVNWSKGVDGQLPGFVSIACVFIGILSYRFIDDPTQFNTAHLAFIVAGAFAGFGIWNFYPQKIMPGYGAGSLAGFFLAVLAILSGAKIATTIMVLGIPTADAIFTIMRRIRAGKSPIWGDRGHLHHKLMDVLGWGRRRIALFYWVTTACLGYLSLQLNTRGKIITMVLVMGSVFAFLIWAKWRSNSTK